MIINFLILLISSSVNLEPICEVSNNSISTYFPNNEISYVINASEICSTSPHILIAVHSSPRNIDKRNHIRNTFGAFKRINDKLIQVIFIVGISNKEQTEKNLLSESENYGDIIQANFIDSYQNLTLKHVSLLNWVKNYCENASYFVKTDDDTMVDIFHLEYFLRVYDLNSDFYCRVLGGQVLRSGKWGVSVQDYPLNAYPMYCEGFAYILTNLQKLSDIVECSLNNKFFWIDDVVVLGNVRDKLNMTLNVFPDNFGYSELNPEVDVSNFIFFRNGANLNNEGLWNNTWNSILSRSVDLYL